MIPSARLIWLILSVAFPAAIVMAVLPAVSVVAAALIGVVAIVAAVDAFLRERALAGVRVELPVTIRAVRGRQLDLEVRILNANATPRRIRLGFVFPSGLDADEDQWVNLPGGTVESRIAWPLVPRRRGRFAIEEYFLEAASPLGLWMVRRRENTRLEIRCYPDLGRDALDALRRGWTGRSTIRQVGRGREFEKLREYSPGDSSDEIHWKATARRGRPITKVFQVERTQEVYVVIDTSRLSGRVCGEEEALEQAIRAALTLGAVAERKGDLFGVAAFAAQVEAFVQARAGKAHFAACRNAINELMPRFESPDFDEIATFLRLRLRRRSLIVFLTSLDDQAIAERFESAVKLLARRHLVLVGMVKPDATRPVFATDVQSTADVYRALAGHMRWKRLRESQHTLARNGVHLSLFEPGKFASSLVNLYDETKQRQLV
jgi:uncharacterized protein (DUF58 family)